MELSKLIIPLNPFQEFKPPPCFPSFILPTISDNEENPF